MRLAKDGQVIFSNEVGSRWEAGAEDECEVDKERGMRLSIDVINDNDYEGKCDSVRDTRRLVI